MQETIFVKPKAGQKIPRPETRTYLDEKGARVPKNTYWARRLADGDVIEAEEPKQEQKPKDEAQAMPEEAMAEAPSEKKKRG